jgi:hypothetical protein
MSDIPLPERYLELFDQLDLDNVEDRRIGVHILRNYFSTVLTDVAIEKLESTPGFGQDYLNEQWRTVLTKFESIPGQLSKELEGLPYQLAQARNPVNHNDRYDPRQDIDDLQEIREKAPVWRDEMEEMAESYFHAWEELNPKEALVDLAKKNLRKVLAVEPQFDRFEQDYSQAHEAAEDAMETLEEEVDADRETIERELVHVVEWSQSLSTYVDSLEQDEKGYADYMANEELDRMRGR